MMLNSEKILNGTERKKLVNGYNELKNNYTRIKAIEYSELYEKKPLSFILNNSEYIFPEGYKGYKFYENVIENFILPYDQYDVQLGKINEYICEFGDKMSTKQKKMYEDLYGIIENVRDMNINSVNLHSEMTNHTSNTAIKLYDTIYLYNNNMITESEMNTTVNDLVLSNKCEFMDIMNCLVNEPALNTKLNIYLESCYVEDTKEPDDFKNNCKIKNILQRMMKDRLFNETVNSIRNTNLRYNIIGLSQLSDSDLLNSIAYEHVDSYDPMFSNMDDAINRVYADQYLAEYNKDKYADEKKMRQESIIGIYETVKEFVLFDMNSIDSKTIYTNNDLSYKLYTESYHDDYPSIEESILALNAQIKQLKTEYMSEKVGGKKYEGSKFIQDMLPDEAKDKNITREKLKKNKSSDSELAEDAPENPYKNNSKKSRKKTSKPKVVTQSEDEDDDDDYDEYNEEEFDDEELDEDEEKENKKKESTIDDKKKELQKTKKEAYRKVKKANGIRNVEASIVQTNAKVDKALSKVNNSVKHGGAIVRGVTQIPREVLKSANDLIQDFELMDENRRKKYLLQPGNRKKWISRMNAVLQYGTAASISPMMIPLTAFYRSHSKTKNKRLANEMKFELDREIKILDDKIAYAKSVENNEEAYKLMRAKSGFEYSLIRLKTNSKAM